MAVRGRISSIPSMPMPTAPRIGVPMSGMPGPMGAPPPLTRNLMLAQLMARLQAQARLPRGPRPTLSRALRLPSAP